ncbi:MAG: PRC-barrel domain-containing protein [Burkholderiales bacterium]
MAIERKKVESGIGIMCEDEMIGVVASRPEAAGTLATAGEIEGKEVRNGDGESLGEIAHLVVDFRTGRLAYAILAGAHGMAGKMVPVPWNALTYEADHDVFFLDVSKPELERAESFDADDWPSMDDRDWADDLHDYYSVQPYWR